MSEQALHVYEDDDRDNWYVAASEADAASIVVEMTGEQPDYEFRQLPDDQALTIRDEDAPEGRLTMTCREWAEHYGGRGLLASTYA